MAVRGGRIVRRKPHTLVVDLPEEVIRQNVVNGHEPDPQGSVAGVLYPTDSAAMYEQYGVETKRGHVFLCDPVHAMKFEVGGTCALGSRRFSVVGEPQTFVGFGGADNTAVTLEEID